MQNGVRQSPPMIAEVPDNETGNPPNHDSRLPPLQQNGVAVAEVYLLTAAPSMRSQHRDESLSCRKSFLGAYHE